MLMLAASGTFAYLNLGRAEDPSFTIKVMVVSAVWPGATAAQMQAQIGLDRVGVVHRRLLGELLAQRAARNLQHRGDLGALGRAQALHALQRLGRGGQQAGHAVGRLQQVLREFEDAAPLQP
eukprot:gene8911-10957_t